MIAEDIAGLLDREMGLSVDVELSAKLARYLELLMRWNSRTNLTAVRSEAEIVLRHFGESLQCARALPAEVGTLLDYGSGAGFPGLVCSLAYPQMDVVLAESQGKKASFLQEACRFIPSRAMVHAGRVEALAVARQFDIVTMRAVDRMDAVLVEALRRVRINGTLAVMTTVSSLERDPFTKLPVDWTSTLAIRGTEQGVIALGRVRQK